MLLAALAAAPVSPSPNAPPALPRARMEQALPGSGWKLVIGTRDSALAPMFRAQALALARRLPGADTAAVITDREARPEALAPYGIVLFGGPAQNAWTERIAGRLPVSFHAGGFRWANRDYDRAGEVLHLVVPSPLDPRRFLLLIAPNAAAALRGEGGAPLFGNEDWRIYRDGVLRRSGTFAQDGARPWTYDAARDHDRDEDERRFAAGLTTRSAPSITLRAPAGVALAEPALASARTLLARLDRIGVRATAPVSLTLYRSLEEKGAITGDTRPETMTSGAAHAALAAGRDGLDLWSVAAARLVKSGADPGSPWLEPAGVALAGRFEGEALGTALARLYFGGLLPSPRAAAAPAATRSRLITVPSRALLLLAVQDVARGTRSPWIASVGSPEDLGALARAAGVTATVIEQRYRALADSLSRPARAAMMLRAPRPWSPGDGFQRGVRLEHQPGLARGYLSAACGRELQRLRALGTSWISLSPYGYLASLNDPAIQWPTPGDPDEETDEAIAEAAARAHALGIQVWLAPRLWSRAWTGDLAFGPEGWERFFAQYRERLLHEALLAERERIEGLIVGHELVSASLRAPDRWRAMIAEVRRVYHGTLTYDANWGDEVRGLAFWDALDVIGVSFVAPLADRPTTAAAALRAGARRQLESLRETAVRVRRPVLLAEVGYPTDRNAPVRPWEEGGGSVSPEAQRACSQAVTEALEGEDWVAGTLWWKWLSDGESGSVSTSFSPRGQPAENVLRRAFQRWRGRAVNPPLTRSAP